MYKTVRYWKSLPTIESGHTDDLKYDSHGWSVWISRCTTADGEPYNNKVTVEYRGEELCAFEATEGDEDVQDDS